MEKRDFLFVHVNVYRFRNHLQNCLQILRLESSLRVRSKGWWNLITLAGTLTITILFSLCFVTTVGVACLLKIDQCGEKFASYCIAKAPVMTVLSLLPSITANEEPHSALVSLLTGTYFRLVWSRLRMKTLVF